MKTLRVLFLVTGIVVGFASCNSFSTNNSAESAPAKKEVKSATARKKGDKNPSPPALKSRLNQAINYIERNNYSDKYCFLVDMRLHSGKKRFFVYDLQKNTVAFSGLVAHGSCNTQFLSQARFSNTPETGCSSLGKYKVGKSYYGQYGRSYKLHGLDNSNSNAFKRAVVLHGFDCVPDREIYPRVLCNSLGCPMVSPSFFRKLSGIIDRSDKPILLWVYR